MNINFKINNQKFIFILIAIILLSLLFSCYHKDVIVEGLTSTCANSTTSGLPPYGKNTDNFWYDISCTSGDTVKYTIIPAGTIFQETSDISCSDISDVSFNDYFDTLTNDYNGYYIDDNKIKRFKINPTSQQRHTIIFNCSEYNKLNGIKLNGLTLYPTFYKGNITNALAKNDSVTIYKYPQDASSSIISSNSLLASTPLKAQAQAQTQNSDITLDLGNVSSILDPSATAATAAATAATTVPALSFPSSINSVLASTQPTIMQDVTNGFNTLFGSGGSSTSLYLNDISYLNGDITTPSTIFTTLDGRQGLATSNNTINGIPLSQIPEGQEDLYILKSQVVPPVCPACPPVIVDKNTINKDCPPCPPCSRCPEPSFDCKKVPNYSLGPENSFLPRPVLNNFSTFGM